MLKEIIAVFIGGGIGSSLRYLTSKLSFITNASFPYSTFITNIMSLLYIFSLLVINEGIPTSFDACKTRKPCEK